MKHFQDVWVQEWCDLNGWSDLFRERYNSYWAFPPNAVMPEPIPQKAMRIIKAEKGLTKEERLWLSSAALVSITAATLSYFLGNPMPVVLAFGFDAITAARLEVEDI